MRWNTFDYIADDWAVITMLETAPELEPQTIFDYLEGTETRGLYRRGEVADATAVRPGLAR